MQPTIHGLSPWTHGERLVPCWLEDRQVYCLAGPVSQDARLVVRTAGEAEMLRGLGYWNVVVEEPSR